MQAQEQMTQRQPRNELEGYTQRYWQCSRLWRGFETTPRTTVGELINEVNQIFGSAFNKGPCAHVLQDLAIELSSVIVSGVRKPRIKKADRRNNVVLLRQECNVVPLSEGVLQDKRKVG